MAAYAIMAVASFATAQPSGPGAPSPPPAVTVITVRSRDITPSVAFIARVQAIQTVNVQARVQGYLQEIDFKEGRDVQKGEPLYVIEPGLYEAAVAAAQANLKTAQINLGYTRITSPISGRIGPTAVTVGNLVR